MGEISVDLRFVILGIYVGLVIEAVADTGQESAVTKDLEWNVSMTFTVSSCWYG